LTPADLAQAREAGRSAGYRQGRADATAETQAALHRSLACIAQRLDDATAAASQVADESAHAVAGLLLDTLAAGFPTLRAAHGEAEVRRFVRDVLPALRRHPRVSVRVHSSLVNTVLAEISALKLHGTPPTVEADEAVAEGDATILWEDGSAVRDTQAAWDAVLAVLRPLGLLTANQSSDAATPTS